MVGASLGPLHPDAMTLAASPFPGLLAAAFTTSFPAALADVPSPDWLVAGLKLDAAAPLERSEAVRQAVRDVLRTHGYKPTGRGKPASEYLVRAASESGLGSINAAVDACNVVSLHAGFPISVVDLDRTIGSVRIGVGAAGDRYVFNASGQEIDVAGLPCLFDDEGPCANAVRDSHRTKTRAETHRTLSVIWGVEGMSERITTATQWYRDLLTRLGSTTEGVAVTEVA